MHLGASTGSQFLHYLLEDAFAGDEIADDFRYRLDALLTFSGGALYAAPHEGRYDHMEASRGGAQRARADFGAFRAELALDGTDPVLFTGEMIYPWMFETDPVLLPLAEAAQI